MSSYVLLDEFSDYVRDQVSGTDDTVKQAALDAAEEMVNEFCQRSFVIASTATTRYFGPKNDTSIYLTIDDCTTVTAVTQNGSTVTSYQTMPRNQISRSGQVRPIESLLATGGYWYWYNDQPLIAVTATWGWSATPRAVDEAVKILAKDILQQRNNNSGVAGFSDFGAVGVRQNPYVTKLLTPLRHADSFGAA